MKIRLKDIAEEAGCSQATVSRVFSNNPRISAAVREKVLQVAARHGYHPHLPAHLRNIVVITPACQEYPAHYCVEMLVMALSGALTQNNFRMEILPLNNLERLKHIQFSGAVAVGIDSAKLLDWEAQFNQPLVVLDREVPGGHNGIWQVSSDEQQCMELAVSHFRERGIKRIGILVFGDPGVGNADIRMQAAREAMAAYGYPLDKPLFAYASQENAREKVNDMLAAGVDGLLCPGHSGGLLTAHALDRCGKKIPEDISLISSEICFFSPFATPPQTTFCPDYPRLAQTAVDVFQARLWRKRFPLKSIVPGKLILRNSVK